MTGQTFIRPGIIKVPWHLAVAVICISTRVLIRRFFVNWFGVKIMLEIQKCYGTLFIVYEYIVCQIMYYPTIHADHSDDANVGIASTDPKEIE